MAIVKAPALSLDASGNLGAVCYSTWRGLSIARDVWTGIVPNTADQVVIQGYMTTVSQAWSGTLTETERQFWRESAREQVRLSRIKTSYIPTGYQYFMQLNMQVIRQALALIPTPPSKIEAYGFGNISVIYMPILLWVFITFGGHFVSPPAGFQGEIWRAGPYDTGGRHAIDPEYKFLSYANLTVTYKDKTVTVSKYYWYRCRWVESKGRVGNWFVKQVYTG